MQSRDRVGLTLNCVETLDGLKSKCPYCKTMNKVLYLQGRWLSAITCKHYLEVHDSAIHFLQDIYEDQNQISEQEKGEALA